MNIESSELAIKRKVKVKSSMSIIIHYKCSVEGPYKRYIIKYGTRLRKIHWLIDLKTPLILFLVQYSLLKQQVLLKVPR